MGAWMSRQSPEQKVHSATNLVDLLALLESPEFQQQQPREIGIARLHDMLRDGDSDQLELAIVDRLLLELHYTVSGFDNGKILRDAVWSIAFLIGDADHDLEQEHQEERVSRLFTRPDLVDSIVALLKSDSIELLTGALCIVDSVTCISIFDGEWINGMFDLGMLDAIVRLLNSLDLHHISCLCLNIIDNFSVTHVPELFSVRRLFESVFRLCHDPDPEKREKAWEVIYSAAWEAPSDIYEYFISGGLASVMKKMSNVGRLDPGILWQVVDLMGHALQWPEFRDHRDYTVAIFRRYGLVEELLRITRRPVNTELKELASSVLHEFFQEDMVRLNNSAPPPAPARPIIVTIRRD